MTDEQVEFFKTVFAAQRVIGKAQLSSRDALRAARAAAENTAPAKSQAAAAPAPRKRVRAVVAGALVIAAYLIAMTSDFWSLP